MVATLPAEKRKCSNNDFSQNEYLFALALNDSKRKKIAGFFRDASEFLNSNNVLQRWFSFLWRVLYNPLFKKGSDILKITQVDKYGHYLLIKNS